MQITTKSPFRKQNPQNQCYEAILLLNQYKRLKKQIDRWANPLTNLKLLTSNSKRKIVNISIVKDGLCVKKLRNIELRETAQLFNIKLGAGKSIQLVGSEKKIEKKITFHKRNFSAHQAQKNQQLNNMADQTAKNEKFRRSNSIHLVRITSPQRKLRIKTSRTLRKEQQKCSAIQSFNSCSLKISGTKAPTTEIIDFFKSRIRARTPNDREIKRASSLRYNYFTNLF